VQYKTSGIASQSEAQDISIFLFLLFSYSNIFVSIAYKNMTKVMMCVNYALHKV